MRVRLIGILLAGSALACVGTDTPTEEEPAAPVTSIQDAVHESGNEHFFWLPPMVSSPTWSGMFDGSLAPTVEICEWDGMACVLPLLAAYTTTTGPGSETVRVVPEDEHYIVNWHTDEFGLDVTKTYRIVARVDGQELGHADVDVVNNGSQLKNVDTQEYIALVDGRTLPIKFRIEDGALITGLWAAVGAGYEFSCAITTTGEGYCWGSHIFGQGGAGFAQRTNRFIQPISGGRTLATIDGASEAHCALTTTGEVWCSGNNVWGILGTTVPLPLATEPCAAGRLCTFDPLMVEGGLTFAELDGRESHTCGLTPAGAAYCWGTSQAQVLGTGTDGTGSPCVFGPANCSPTPVPVLGGLTFTTMAVGHTSCGLTAPGDPLGNVWCWGENTWGPVGNGTNNNRYYAPVRGGGEMEFVFIDGGSNNTCALTAAGDAYCWGWNDRGQLGIGDNTLPGDCTPTASFVACAKTPVAVPGGLKFVKLSVAEELAGDHVCGITVAQDAYCWGYNDKGQVGDGASTTQYNAPTLVIGGHKFIDIATGGAHTCGVTVERDIYCWGNNSAGQLGAGVLPGDPDTSLGDTNPHPTPVKVLDPA